MPRRLRQSGGEERYVWTVAAWLLYEYLEQASTEQRRRMEKAIADGDFAWHAMPFTWNSEMLDRSLICIRVETVGFAGPALWQENDRR